MCPVASLDGTVWPLAHYMAGVHSDEPAAVLQEEEA